MSSDLHSWVASASSKRATDRIRTEVRCRRAKRERLLVTPFRRRCPSWIAYRPGPSQSGQANSNSSGVAIWMLLQIAIKFARQRSASGVSQPLGKRGALCFRRLLVPNVHPEGKTVERNAVAGEHVRGSALMLCMPSRTLRHFSVNCSRSQPLPVGFWCSQLPPLRLATSGCSLARQVAPDLSRQLLFPFILSRRTLAWL